jgi:glycosyltransferase involved in cell wall biosynthesis
MTQAERTGVPLFSVVIPLYNKRPFIRRAVDSVLGQTFTDFELIVIDDGSTDGSHEVLADIADPRFRLVRQANAGVGAARNAGIREAAGQWVAFLDGDDKWMPWHLAELKRVSGRFPDSGLISSGCIELHADAELPGLQKNGQVHRVDYFREAGKNVGFLNSSSSAIRREILDLAGGFGSGRLGEDLEYWARIALHHPVATSTTISCIYFRATGGAMETLANQPVMSRIVSLKDLSSSVATILEALERGDHKVPADSLCAYVNSRLLSTLLGAVRYGEFGYARSLVTMQIGTGSAKFFFIRCLLLAPDAVLSQMLKVGLYLRNAVLRRRV